MSKSFRIGTGIVALVLFSCALWSLRVFRPSEPIYKGRPLSFWARGYHSFSPPLGPREAEEAVRHAGTNAIPCLLRMIRAHDSRLKLMVIRLAQKQHFVKINNVSAWEWNWNGAFGFGTLAADAKDAVPALIAIYNEDISESSQGAAAIALDGMGPAAKQAIPSLLQGLAKTTGAARGNTLVAIATIDPDSKVTIATLMKCLHEPDAKVRWCAVASIGQLSGRAATQAVLAVSELLHDPDKSVREIAESTLQRIDRNALTNARPQ